MTSADRNWENQLNDYLDALAAGTAPATGDLDASMREAVNGFFAYDDAPAPRDGRASQIWEELMNQTSYAGAIPQIQPIVAQQPSQNGRPTPPAVRMPIPLSRPAPARWRFALLAVAALLLIALGFGFRALDPFGSRSEQPNSIPAAVVPSASPTAYPLTDHPFIGVWKWSTADDPNCCSPGIADADGTYVDYDSFSGVGIGTWRATGPRTAELSYTIQHVLPRDMFDSDQIIEGAEFEPVIAIWHISIEVDETGNTATFKGGVEVRNSMGGLIARTNDIDWTGVRLVPDPSTTATPTS